MKTRLLPAAGVLACALLALTACDASKPTPSSSPGDGTGAASAIPGPDTVATACRTDLKVGLVTINLQALFFNQINTGAQTIADKAGVDLQIVSANDDPLAQVTAVEQLITQGVDAVIVLPIDTEGIKPAIDAAASSKVPVVVVDGIVESDAIASMVGTANAESSKKLAEFLAAETTERGEIGIVGALNSTIQLDRQKGFVDQAVADGFTEGTIVDGKNVQETAQSASENLLTGNPDLKFAFATGEPALVGLAAAVETQNAGDRISVVGWDLSQSAVTGLKEGWLKGIVQQNTFGFGYEGMNAAINAACGEKTEKFVPIETTIVTPENYTDYLYYLEK
ncbi:substrate-binding domain-containing protein [Mycetocola spongiae]|uniref:substrate-binding domain-containing protein n=1 Tax=Mycetocola spongiae TaxID=2859226 RepID=UPI001CF0D8BB|nr:substrate-binding domain-containing protein [Mycetocola spongiae]UCR89175.1 substrate-binding domain-containing protein [Mycetocola spongiae]